MSKPRVHAEVIKAWVDGAEIEYCDDGCWTQIAHPSWNPNDKYRIKPKPDLIIPRRIELISLVDASLSITKPPTNSNMEFIFDGETGLLKNVVFIGG